MRKRLSPSFIRKTLPVCGAIALALGALTSCAEIKKPSVSPFYGKSEPLATQELRWSNGGLPKTLDPLRATAAPETDVIRALFDGLTEIDSQTLAVQPAVAQTWTASKDFKTWTFNLRRDARWSNGASVTAQDFVRSWERVFVSNGENAALFANIGGVSDLRVVVPTPQPTIKDSAVESSDNSAEPVLAPKLDTTKDSPPRNAVSVERNGVKMEIPATSPATDANEKKRQPVIFGVTATDEYTLRVMLVKPDENFPSLVAHTAFRPIFDEAEMSVELPAKLTTNGAFRLVSADQNGVVAEKSANYWNAPAINLNRVRFIPAVNSETALQAYQAGEIDVMTNATFEPLAVKLIAPYEDFRRETFSALNFYEFNTGKPPFDNASVRKALAIAIDRESLAREDLKGIAEPARRFLPGDNKNVVSLNEDVEKAREILAEAGFPDGKNFPKVTLLVNRNDLQKRVAQSVAAMWRKNLGIETNLIIKDRAEYEESLKYGDFDLVRRGLVMPTTNETSNIASLFARYNHDIKTRNVLFSEKMRHETNAKPDEASLASLLGVEKSSADTSVETSNTPENVAESSEQTSAIGTEIVTEADAMEHLAAIPLYFATSQTMIKPYVRGFSPNLIDSVSLKQVSIETKWQQPADNSSWFKDSTQSSAGN